MTLLFLFDIILYIFTVSNYIPPFIVFYFQDKGDIRKLVYGMAKFVTIVLFLMVIGITSYIYLNFESLNFISDEPVPVQSSAQNRVISGSRLSNNVDIDDNFWFTEESTQSVSEMQWTRGTEGYKESALQTLKELSDQIFSETGPRSGQTAVQTVDYGNTLVHYPPLPPQEWVQQNILAVLKYLDLPKPVSSNWSKAGLLPLLKSYYSPTANVIYAGIPKSGCTNWKFTILKIEGMFDDDVPSPKVHYIINKLNMAHTVYKYNRQTLNSKYTFTVIRNPWTRMASGYNDKFSSSRVEKWQRGKVALQILKKYRDRNMTLRDVLEAGARPTFLEFLHHIAYDPISEINAHFRPQYTMLGFSSIIYNFVGSLEHAKEQSMDIFTHLRKVSAKDLSVPGPYDSSSDPRTERSTLFAKERFKNIPPDLIEIIYEKYKPDFMIYNYSNFTDQYFPFPLYHS